MPRELSQFENYLVHEFVEDYVDGIMSRRDMMRRVLHITGGVAATATVLTQLGVKSASAQEGTPAPPPTPTGPRSTVSVAEDDPRITASDMTFSGLDGAEITAYQAMPSSGDGPFPVVLICHENRGLTPHIRDVARRWAKQGYVAAALDLLSREGGTASIADPGRDSGAPFGRQQRCRVTSTTSRPPRPTTARRSSPTRSPRHDRLLLRRWHHLARRHPDAGAARRCPLLRPAAAAGGCAEYPSGGPRGLLG